MSDLFLKHRRQGILTLLISLGLALTTSFVACSKINLNHDQPATESAKGGTGFDGKTYWSYGECGESTDVSDIIEVNKDGISAALVKENCQKLSRPIALPISNLKYVEDKNLAFTYSGKIFDAQVHSPGQRVTLNVCSNTSVQSVIWRQDGARSGIFGQLKLAGGQQSEDLESEVTGNGYQSLPSQPSQFDLNLNGTLSFSIDGSTSQTVSGLSCLYQPESIRMVRNISTALTIPFGVDFLIQATEAGHLLAIGLSSENNSGKDCIVGIKDNAVGGGNVYQSANAFVTGPNGKGSEIWYAANSLAGATKVTLSVDPSCTVASQYSVFFAEFSGVAKFNPLDGPAVTKVENSSSGTLVTAPEIVTKSASGLVFSIATAQAGISSINTSNGFETLLVKNGNGVAFKFFSAVGPVAPISWNQSQAAPYCGSTVAFRAGP